MKADALMQSIETWLKQLAAELREGHTQGFVGFLEKMGRFPRYSARNTLLILLQRPDATLVAGMKRWNELGRRVRKGERAIAILAPTLKRVEVVDEETGEVREERQIVGFHTAYVFDVSQTEGAPLEPARVPASEDALLYAQLAAACPVPVEEGLLRAGMVGKTDGKRIVLAADLSPAHKAETLLHEWAHVLLHFDGARREARVKELEAEATAYAAGRQLGLTMESSRDYILHWQGTVEGLEGALERIMRGAREILEALPAQPERGGSIEGKDQGAAGAAPLLLAR
ncbi:ArdC-like ssDNA-binding domain-containing protein [Meiothermus sp. PNK-Is4]|uniref:ArdC-like ssDNA-binding domain-containing protein n=1 Tax=Meiothermus sp. PNK-Is4 TaxID=2740565 RepID=UPI0020C39634|nr:ArdC-like ssDNA-binding domain-containing protein [Meiothermus sp. PNK-Is4]